MNWLIGPAPSISAASFCSLSSDCSAVKRMIVAWQWLPFATLFLLTSLQSLDGEQ